MAPSTPHCQAPAQTDVIHIPPPFSLFPRAERFTSKNKPPPSPVRLMEAALCLALCWGQVIEDKAPVSWCCLSHGIQCGHSSTTEGRTVNTPHPGMPMAPASPLSSANQGSRTILTAWKGDPQRNHEQRQIVTAVGWEGITITFILH